MGIRRFKQLKAGVGYSRMGVSVYSQPTMSEARALRLGGGDRCRLACEHTTICDKTRSSLDTNDKAKLRPNASAHVKKIGENKEWSYKH